LCAIETHTYGTYNCPDEIHHPEQAVCIGEEFELIPTTTADSYMWIQADGSGVRAPSMKDLLNQETTKEYKCLAIKAANNEGEPILEYNMMPNGDFEDTESTNNHYNGFTSSYTFYELDEDFPQRQGAQDDKNGYYRISSDASTSGNHYLECDGDDYEPEDITISYAAILNGSIVKGQAYQFAFSGITIGGSNFANITFNLLLKDETGNVIKTEPLISNQIINNTTWQQFGMGQNWTADNDYPQAEIQLINHTKGWGGNDFALDNIIFQAVYSNENNTEIILAEEYFTVVASECIDEENWEVEFLKGSSQTIEPNVTGLGYKWFDQDGNPVLDENGQQVTTPTLTIVVDKTQHYTCEVDLGQGKTHYEYITVKVYDPINLDQCETDVVTLTPSKQGSYAWYLLGDDNSKVALSEPTITGTKVHCEHLSTIEINRILCVITTPEGTRDEQWNITVHANPTFEVTVTGRDATIETKSDYTNLVLDGQVEFTETWINTLNIGEHTLTMTDGYGCSSTSTFEVVPVPIKPMVFFTPNNDNNHDYWQVEGIDFYPEAVIQIFDRYHRLLTTLIGFENIKAGWDGMYNGHQMPMDDYWYVIMIPENNQQISGHFTLKR
jgi:gliding motility-associated-like protein